MDVDNVSIKIVANFAIVFPYYSYISSRNNRSEYLYHGLHTTHLLPVITESYNEAVS